MVSLPSCLRSLLLCCCLGPFAAAAELPRVRMDTALGAIVVELDTEAAPVTAGHFLALVEDGRFDGTGATFYRSVTLENQPTSPVPIEVVQGGLGSGADDVPTVRHETTVETGLRHLDGVISMARSAPGTASSEFFVCVNDQPELDFGGRRNPDGQGFAAFGRVVEGMEVVRAIQAAPTRPRPADGEDFDGQRLLEPVAIRRIVPSSDRPLPRMADGVETVPSGKR